jgi:hypothetical protein
VRPSGIFPNSDFEIFVISIFRPFFDLFSILYSVIIITHFFVFVNSQNQICAKYFYEKELLAFHGSHVPLCAFSPCSGHFIALPRPVRIRRARSRIFARFSSVLIGSFLAKKAYLFALIATMVCPFIYF